MKVKQVLNNNVVIAIENREELVVMGRGLAFKKKPGEVINPEKVEKTFILKDQGIADKLAELMQEVSEEYLDLSYRIIDLAKKNLPYQLNDYLYVALTDHLSFAISRHNNRLDLKNPLLWEIRKYYRQEFQTAIQSLTIIEQDTGVRLAEDEAASIALHLVNSQMSGENMESAVKVTQMVDDILTIIRYYFQLTLDEQSISYERFLTHLRFFAIRLNRQEEEHEMFDQFLYEQVRNKYKEAFKCTERISTYINKEYGWQVSENEKIYLTLHIHRVTSRHNEKK